MTWFFIKRLKERQRMRLLVNLLHPKATVPTRGSENAAGFDLYTPYKYNLMPGQTGKIDLGIATAIPEGMVGIIKDRSSLAAIGITTLGGVIDSDYRGEWSVILKNTSPHPHFIACDDRIAQVVFIEYQALTVDLVDELPDTLRGSGGFGSTGR